MMNFEYTRHVPDGKERALERFFEIIPGLVSWSVLLGALALSFFKPITAAAASLVFVFYWLLRLFYTTIFMVLSYAKLASGSCVNWMEKVDRLDFSKNGPVMHLVIIPVARENGEILEPGIHSLATNRFPSGRMLVILAVEETAPARVKEDAARLAKKYRPGFLDFLVVIHPSGLPGEAKVKGANATYAAKKAADYFLKKGIAFENVVVSCFDADTVVSSEYFACLTHAFMSCPQRLRASFQPIPVYHNNLWDVPALARVLEVGSSFFILAEATYPDKLVTFSSHSMSFKALVDVGYWPVDMVSDDSAIFWKAFIHYDGDYRVLPIYVTVSMDIADEGGFWKTLVQVYRQKRRWAWGAENFPVVMRAFLKAKRIPFFKKLAHGFKLFEGHLAWATWSFLLTFIWLPVFLASREFSDTVAYFSVPRMTGLLFRLASASLLVTIVLSLMLLPKRALGDAWWRKVLHVFEWLLIPAIAVFFSALPALDAQTRLMLGNDMRFSVTGKRKRKRNA